MVIKRALSILILLSATSPAGAEELFQLFESHRTLGMGGASLSVADDDLAVFANPAAVARIRNFRATPLDMQLTMSGTFYSPISQAVSNLTSGGEKNPIVIIGNSADKYHYLNFSIVPHVVAQNFSLHTFFRTQTGMITKSTTSEFFFRRRNDAGLVAGIGIPLFGGIVKLGASGKVVHRGEVNETFAGGTTYNSITLDDLYKEGLGIGADAGAIITAPIRWLPTISARVRNPGAMKFSTPMSFYSASSSGRAPPPQEDMMVDAGFSLSPRLGGDSYLNIAYDMRDVLGLQADGSSAQSYYRHSHLGMEFVFDRIFYLRFGAYQGYPTFGFALLTRRFSLELLFYGVEVGTVAQPDSSYRSGFRVELGF